MNQQPKVSVFLSSPADVVPERQAAERIVQRLNAIYTTHVELAAMSWEQNFYEAEHGLQGAIPPMEAFDVVVGILWSRIGSKLPPSLFSRPDGTPYESGTVYEIETALEATRRSGRPTVYVFKSQRSFTYSAESVDEERAQKEALDRWWARTFRNEAGQYVGATNSFGSTEDFEAKFENCLVSWLQERGYIPAESATMGVPASAPDPVKAPPVADVFLSYAREDRTRVTALVDLLESEGWSVLRDRIIPSGESFSSHIGQALEHARCVVVVVVWSKHSVQSDWVIHEAKQASERGVLVPVLLDAVHPPVDFQLIQAADLSEWREGRDSPAASALLAKIAEVLDGGATTRSAAAKPASAGAVASVLTALEGVLPNLRLDWSLDESDPFFEPPPLPRRFPIIVGDRVALVITVLCALLLVGSISLSVATLISQPMSQTAYSEAKRPVSPSQAGH